MGDGKGKRDTGDQPDFTPEDIEIMDEVWDKIGKAESPTSKPDRMTNHIKSLKMPAKPSK